MSLQDKGLHFINHCTSFIFIILWAWEIGEVINSSPSWYKVPSVLLFLSCLPCIAALVAVLDTLSILRDFKADTNYGKSLHHEIAADAVVSLSRS